MATGTAQTLQVAISVLDAAIGVVEDLDRTQTLPDEQLPCRQFEEGLREAGS